MTDFVDRQATMNAVGLTTDAINFNPTKYVDAQGNELVAVVRCKDCRFYLQSNEKCGLIDTRLHFYETDKAWTADCFCSWGERREEERLVMPPADGSTIKIGKMDEVEDG